MGRKNNDFGLGFYCTANVELAKEWAVSSPRSGFYNQYTLDTEYLKVLNLNNSDYTILNWSAVLIEHRLFSIKTPVAGRAKKYLIDNFGINVNAYDVIIGYCADDSYFDYAESFLNNSISVEQLASAMKLGKLGEQIVVKSKYAFSNLKFVGFDVTEREQSGVNLRSIQMYEQRNKDINKASADTIYRIANTLGCTMEDLIEK